MCTKVLRTDCLLLRILDFRYSIRTVIWIVNCVIIALLDSIRIPFLLDSITYEVCKNYKLKKKEKEKVNKKSFSGGVLSITHVIRCLCVKICRI